MSYHLSIVKTTPQGQIPISKGDVLEYVKFNDSIEVVNSKSDALIMQCHLDNGRLMDLFWNNGELWVENPDGEIIDALVNIASYFNARVRGDELETYISSKETYIHPDDKEVLEQQEVEGVKIYSFSKRLISKLLPFIIFLLLGLIIHFITK